MQHRKDEAKCVHACHSVCLCFFWQTRFGVISKHLLFYRGLIVEQSHTCSHLLGNPLYTRMRCLRSTRVGRS